MTPCQRIANLRAALEELRANPLHDRFVREAEHTLDWLDRYFRKEPTMNEPTDDHDSRFAQYDPAYDDPDDDPNALQNEMIECDRDFMRNEFS